MTDPAPTCPTHPHVRLLCPACTGGQGGKSTSPAKRAAVRKNVEKATRVRMAKRAKERES